MKKLILLFFIPCFFLTSCNKDKDKEIMGKWKLVEISISINYAPSEKFDYSEKNITYDFISNNKLIVSGKIPNDLFIFDYFQEGEHSYEYNELQICPTCTPSYNLFVDSAELGQEAGCYFCDIHLNNNTMEIGASKTIDGDFYNYSKTFTKIK